MDFKDLLLGVKRQKGRRTLRIIELHNPVATLGNEKRLSS